MGMEQQGAPLVLRTSSPGGPSQPTALVAVTSGSARNRKWDWNDNQESNLKGYNTQVYDTATLNGSGDPSGVLKKAKFVRSSKLTYNESGLGASTKRYCRVQAVLTGDTNDNQLRSPWTSLVEAEGTKVKGSGTTGTDIDPGSVGTSDAAANAFTDPYANISEPVVILIVNLQDYVVIQSPTVSLNGGRTLIQVEGRITLPPNWTRGYFVRFQLYSNFNGGGDVPMGPSDIVVKGIEIPSTTTEQAIIPFNFTWWDGMVGSPRTGSVVYRAKMHRNSVAGSSVAASVSVQARIFAVEFKR
jgi:hypothetical protein